MTSRPVVVRWRTRSDGTWRLIEGPELLTRRDAEGDAITAINVTSSGQMNKHVELLMKTMQGFRKIGDLVKSRGLNIKRGVRSPIDGDFAEHDQP